MSTKFSIFKSYKLTKFETLKFYEMVREECVDGSDGSKSRVN